MYGLFWTHLNKVKDMHKFLSFKMGEINLKLSKCEFIKNEKTPLTKKILRDVPALLRLFQY